MSGKKHKGSPDSASSHSKLQQTIEKLLRKNFELRMEVEYLKKWVALVRAEEAAEKKRQKSSRN